MKGLGVFLIILGIILFIIGVYDYSVISTKSSWYGARQSTTYCIVLIFLGIGSVIGGSVMCAVKSRSAKIYKTCPKCAEKIKKEAKICRYCGHKFEESE